MAHTDSLGMLERSQSTMGIQGAIFASKMDFKIMSSFIGALGANMTFARRVP